MLCSVNSCLESLTNPEGRFATLDGLFCLRDECGMPRFSITSYSVNFAVEWRGLSYTLKCQVCDDPEVRHAAETLSERLAGVDSPFLTSYGYYPGELLVFDDTGRPMRLDVILQRQPQGVALGRFVELCRDDTSRSAAIAAFRSLCAMARWCGEFGFVHRNLKPHNIVVSPLGHAVMVNYEFAALRRGDDDVRRLLAAAMSLLVAACAPRCSERFSQSLLTGRTAEEVVSVVAGAARDLHLSAVEELSELYAASKCRSVGVDELSGVLSRLETYGDALYHKMDNAIARALECRSSECAAEYADHDFSRYELTGPESDGMICVKDTDGYKYLDRSGRLMINRTYAYAGDFAEERAVVVTESGMALIDLDGRCVVGPDCDDVTWDCYNNVAIVARDGHWGLFDRSGNTITGMTFDWMGECDCGLIPVERGGRFGYINLSGVEVISCRYDQVYSFRDDKALVELAGEQFMIDTSGNRLPVPCEA